ncbi:MAG TPA: ABC transporter ATP-binding protein [Actinomycetota bacterium]|nr:ABC transporter ATP-binding protein [Actinomycetota bacterium]
METARPVYEVTHLHKAYRSPPVQANTDISFFVHPGEAFGLLGRNGAGKTTLVKQLVGLLAPSSGEVRLFGELVRGTSAGQVGERVAYLPQGLPSLGDLRVLEAVTWTAMLRGAGKASARAETGDLLERLDLEQVADRQLRKLSGGQRRLVQIAMTLAGSLPVIILDEPTADIDPGLRKRIWQMLAARAREGAALILVTHDVAEAEQVLDRVAIMDRGSIVAAGSPGELKARLAHRTRIEVVTAKDGPVDPMVIANDLAEGAIVRGRHISAWVPRDEAIRRLEKLMSAVDMEALEDVRLVTPTLEDVLLESGVALSAEDGSR